MTEEAIFRAALQRDTPQQRAAFLDEACGSDPELRGRVERMLETYQGPLVHPGVPNTSLEVTVDSGVPQGVKESSPAPGGEPEVNTAIDPFQNPAEASVSATHGTYGLPPFSDGGPVPLAPELSEAGPVRYRTLRLLAGGGLGEVFVALDEELHREVALKEILPALAQDPDSRQRFVMEAEITGGLEHPGIVPVYSLGQHADGRPFYAMRLIKGESLRQAIERFHRAGNTGSVPGEWTLELRQLLGRFVAVCNAMAYAHSRGVVHRDLKPDNIMLGPYGETLIVDWGLAKAMGGTQTMPASTEGTFVPLSSGDVKGTQVGQILGTPSYMAPEQAAGRLHKLGPTSDVYSLGATLYCLLTNRPPFVGKDLHAVLCKVHHGDFPPPRQINRRVSRALEAVCLKAMALEEADRYPSARALADDVEHWLADRPVTAYPEPLVARLSRWARRHRMVVTQLMALLLTAVIGLLIGTVLISRSRREAVDALAREQKAHQERARAQVETLLNANPQAVPGLLASVDHYLADVMPQLRADWNQPATTDNRSRLIRVGLILLPVDADAVKDRLFDWMLGTDDPHELLLLRNALYPYKTEFKEVLWQLAADPHAPTEKRFHALAVLVAFEGAGPNWEQYGDLVADQFLSVDPQRLGAWAEALRPARKALLAPLARVFRSGPENRRWLATSLLADYGADQSHFLADLIADADERQYAVLLPRLRARQTEAIAALRQEVARTPPPVNEVQARQVLARRQAQAAVTLLQLGHADPVWPLLQHSHDDNRRSFLLHLLAWRGTAPDLLIRRLQTETDVSARRALLLSLGECGERVSAEQRRQLEPLLLRWFGEDPDPGLHSATDWLLRRWELGAKLRPIQDALAGRPPGTRQWFINGQGQTFAFANDPVTFSMGSPPYEPGRVAAKEAPHSMHIPRAFAVAALEVSVAEFQRFRKNYYFAAEYSPGPQGPAINVSWYDAAAYCNWLNEQEGVPRSQWCFPEKIEPGMKLPPDYLSRTGYRLPTEAEWEYACRAGSITSRFYGDSEELLEQYAWHDRSTHNVGTRPVGLLKPNDWGLFDIHGNVADWCLTRWLPDDNVPAEASGKDSEDPLLQVVDTQLWGYRGGGFFYRGSNVRTAYRIANHPSYKNYHVGFRLARTMPNLPKQPATPPRSK
jgi:serine/threonine protein kinase/formylglycine-generating enzyme required for sulfatase activity